MLKRNISCILTILITFITVVVIYGYKINDDGITTVISNNKPDVQDVDDNTGYIFDDFNKAVNIKLNDVGR